jgi:hypothetical protein
VYAEQKGEVSMVRTSLILVVLLVLPISGATQQTHWAFKTPMSPTPPKVQKHQWVKNAIDAFILKRLEKRGLAPSRPADRLLLLRRVTFDLTGLPPTRQEVSAFLADKTPQAYEKVVNRLLASPHYGERWAQHWLDVVRFAETNGYELDEERPQAWRYRDYVVRAFNDDMPYNRFLLEQIAGDEIAPQKFEAHVATGFLRAGPRHVVGGNQDEALNRQEWLTEAVGGIGNAVLGLTVGCARCHDHKYDPLSQKDYYGLQAFFSASDDHTFKQHTSTETQAYEAATKAHKARLQPLLEQISALEKPYYARLRAEKRARLEDSYRTALDTPAGKRTKQQRELAEHAETFLNVSWDEMLAILPEKERAHRAELRNRLHSLELVAPSPLPMALGVSDVLKPTPATFLLVRGEPHVRGAEVMPNFPAVLRRSGESLSAKVGRRTALAEWLVHPSHPLTARVMVNRLWQVYFGKGLVRTPNDFGMNGTRPTHPELLDWLATEFVRGGWSLKRMQRLIVLSNTYQQVSSSNTQNAKRDPQNILLWRQNRKRLDAEALRDSILFAAGTLNPAMGGASVRVPLEPEVVDTIFTEAEPDNLWQVDPDPKQHTRRSLYLVRKRNVRLPLLAVFDMPDRMLSCAARDQSISALQPLTLLNSPFMQQQSRALALSLLQNEPKTEARINALFYRMVSRPPTQHEVRTTERFLSEHRKMVLGQEAELALWTDLCLALFNLNDFVMVR